MPCPDWRAELLAAGWTSSHTGTVWKRPSDGALFLGPYKAWLIMTGRWDELNKEIKLK